MKPAVHRTALSSLAALAVAVSAACAPFSRPEPRYPAEPGDAAPVSDCVGLCLDDDAVDAFADAAARLSTCTMAADESFANDPSGLRVLDVDLRDDEAGNTHVVVVIANTIAEGVFSYPSSVLAVTDGDARLGASGDLGTEADLQLYGLFGCDTSEATFPIAWGQRSQVRLRASVFNNLGDDLLGSVELTVGR